MKLYWLPRTLLVFCVVLLGMVRLSVAVSSHTYGPNEFVTIENGRSPDGKYSIAAHGAGENSALAFNLFLMDAAGKVIEMLPGIDGTNTRSTDAAGYDAKWSTDSSEVSISWSSARKEAPAKARYRIKNGHISKISGPK